MPGGTIKSGDLVVAEFIASLAQNSAVDELTRDAIQRLHAEGRLTKTKLLGLLGEHRASAVQEHDTT